MSTTAMSSEIFEQTEFRDYKDHAVWLYLCVKSDMAGVIPIKIRSVTSDLGMRKSMFLEIIDHFKSVGLIEIGPTKECVWVIGKCDWTLYSGKAQQKQFTAVSNRLKKASKPNRMGEQFAERAVQVVAAQHSFVIPLPKPSQSLWIESDTESESETESEDVSLPPPTPSDGGQISTEALRLYETIQFSPLASAVNRDRGRKWVQSIIDEFPHAAMAVGRMIEHYQTNALDPPHPSDIWKDIRNWIKNTKPRTKPKTVNEKIDELIAKRGMG